MSACSLCHFTERVERLQIDSWALVGVCVCVCMPEDNARLRTQNTDQVGLIITPPHTQIYADPTLFYYCCLICSRGQDFVCLSVQALRQSERF